MAMTRWRQPKDRLRKLPTFQEMAEKARKLDDEIAELEAEVKAANKTPLRSVHPGSYPANTTDEEPTRT